MNLVLIKYNAGNIGSVLNALGRLGLEAEVTDDPATIRGADKVIFPGVGEASTTMRYLRENGLDRVIPSLTQPVLGICLGMQLLCSWSEEGDTKGMGVFDEKVRLFRVNEKIPHMGWNSISFTPEGLFAQLTPGAYVYFVHSFYAETGMQTLATCRHGIDFSAALRRDNFYATQFHPEKSGETGLRILQNFLDL
ncbi:MAG TPA: imidazole glycerol phosphate synthase subunit HisH [Bacteroidales bacterium]|nr:imidazole glycerol phosphate synthase subunit HisH [Bacteroidales bacterium]